MTRSQPLTICICHRLKLQGERSFLTNLVRQRGMGRLVSTLRHIHKRWQQFTQWQSVEI
jgi:hypothetical protein